MRKLYFLMMLLTGFTGFAFAPPVINTPPNGFQCDGDFFDLPVIIPQVLGALDPNLYTTTFHYTQADADANMNRILSTAISVGVDTRIYVRVQDNANPSDFSVVNFWIYLQAWNMGTISSTGGTFCGNASVTFEAAGGQGPYTFYYGINGSMSASVTTTGANNSVTIYIHGAGIYDVGLGYIQSASSTDCFHVSNNSVHIEITPGPVAGQPIDLIIDQPVASGNSAPFDLTDNFSALTNGQPGLTVVYYNSFADAESDTNVISPPSSHQANTGTQIGARVVDGTGCYTIKTFHLYVRHPAADFVFIPDLNLKAIILTSSLVVNRALDLNGNTIAVDANHDNEIQYTEAANISKLILDTNPGINGYYNLIGLEAFYNMKNLNIYGSTVLTTLDATAFPLLESLYVGDCSINTLDFSNCPNLKKVECYNNNLTSLDFSANHLVTDIDCKGNHLTTLNLAGATLLTKLDASVNNLTSINTADLDSIDWLFVHHNNLTSLDVSGLDTMTYLYCNNNQIDNLATTGCTNLIYLYCEDNQMTELNVLDAHGLQFVECSRNTFVNLDFSGNPILCYPQCTEIPSLNWVNLKNGTDSCFGGALFDGSPNIHYLCCDDNEVESFKNYFQGMGMTVNVNSYCIFTPGGDYNTITSNFQYDDEDNGCDVDDGGFPYVKLNINDGTNTGSCFTNATGQGVFNTLAGNFTITPSIENTTWFVVSPPSVMIPFSNTNNNAANQNFCIKPSGIHPDLEIIIQPLSAARPGFTAYYNIVVRNKGNTTITQLNGITLSYDIEKLDFISAQPSPSLQSSDFLSWHLDALSPFETKTIQVSMHVHAPTDSSAVNLGDVLTFDAVVNPIDGDENPADNEFQFNQTVVGSFDPNEIVCLEGNIVSPIEIGNYLHYTVNFENTGTADAENIVVREVIDPTQFDVSSLQMLYSSASVTARLTGNVAEFIFPSINLHSGGHGNILIKIKTKNTLVAGATVTKAANIYFDYNFPVETLPENTLFQTLSNPDIPNDASISVYPNPTKGNVNINCSNNIKSVQLYDVQGRVLQTNLVNETQTTIDISGQSNGVYFLKIISDKGIGVQKIVRE